MRISVLKSSIIAFPLCLWDNKQSAAVSAIENLEQQVVKFAILKFIITKINKWILQDLENLLDNNFWPI